MDTQIPNRFDRNVRLFGSEGQKKLLTTEVVIVGVGGLGSPLAQQLALLGVAKINLVDDEELDDTNRNRFVGAHEDDPVPGSRKVDIAARLIKEINQEVEVERIPTTLVSEDAFEAIKRSDVIFGCFDEDGPRHILNELCAAYERIYIDAASDVAKDRYGGRVCVAWDGRSCLACLNELDSKDVDQYLKTGRAGEPDEVYGVKKQLLDRKGPSVAPINGVVASLAATEFMAMVTGMRKPFRLLNYKGHMGVVTKNDTATDDCLTCRPLRALGARAEIEQYLKVDFLRKRPATL